MPLFKALHLRPSRHWARIAYKRCEELGRGDWEEGEHPAHWRSLVDEVFGRRSAEIRSAWELARRTTGGDAKHAVELLLAAGVTDLLRCYPEAVGVLSNGGPSEDGPTLRPGGSP